MKHRARITCPRCKDADFVDIVEVNADTARFACKSCLLRWSELPTHVTNVTRPHREEAGARKACVRAATR